MLDFKKLHDFLHLLEKFYQMALVSLFKFDAFGNGKEEKTAVWISKHVSLTYSPLILTLTPLVAVVNSLKDRQLWSISWPYSYYSGNHG